MQPQSVDHAAPDHAQHTPLDMLSDMLRADMKAVNALILHYMQSDIPLIPRLAQYLIAAGGKRIRPLLTLASTALFNGPVDRAHGLAAAVEFIHTATLLHDDVVDNSDERRGQKPANLVFGNQASVLVGDFLFSRAFQMMVESGSLEILRILSNAAAVIAQGEVLQLSAANDIETGIPVYLNVVEAKTAALFAASCEVGAVLSAQGEEIVTAMRTYGAALGTAFQIVDDALDYAADRKVLGKDIGNDFREGKMTAPVIFALEYADEAEKAFWTRTLRDKTHRDGDFDRAMDSIARHNALDRTMALAGQYAQDARTALAPVPEGRFKEVLCDLTEFTMTRCA